MKRGVLKNVLLSVCVLASLGLQGCNKQAEVKTEGAGKYGMMDDNTPDLAAVKFFNVIYKDKDISRALTVASPKMERLLKSYHTPRNVQRHVFNLSYDEVEITIDPGSGVGRDEFAKDAVITLLFSGTLHGDKYEDLRVVEMIREGNKWKVDKVRADKYL
jgi:hypothetical protein